MLHPALIQQLPNTLHFEDLKLPKFHDLTTLEIIEQTRRVLLQAQFIILLHQIDIDLAHLRPIANDHHHQVKICRLEMRDERHILFV